MAMQMTDAGTPYWVDGVGPTVIFVHGVLMDHRTWQYQVDGLSGDFRVVRINMIGHGHCPGRAGERTLDEFVEQVHEAITHICPDEMPVLVGFSMGGLVAQAYAIARPSRLRALVLMNAVYNRTSEEQKSVRARLENLEEVGIQAVIGAARERWFRDDEAAEYADEIDVMMQWMRDGDLSAKTNAYRVFATADTHTAGKLGQISCPALVMTGEGDRGSPPHMSEAMAAEIPNARLRIFERQQHMMPVLDAEHVNAELRDFFQSLPERNV